VIRFRGIDIRPVHRAGGAAVALAFGIAVAGCGGDVTDTLPRQEISGGVTLGGKPLARGVIQFQPASQGVAAGGEIKDGKFAIARAGGPVPGDYKVIISSAGAAEKTTEPLGPPGASTPPPVEPIPARYNTASKLTARVEAGKVNSFDFPLDLK
jgi:hypothetical protein